MNLTIEPANSTPVYEQIRAQIAEQIARQELPAGTKLPTIRALAAQLGLAVNTVAHAYRELESAGLIKTRPRHGTTVASSNSSRALLREAARDYALLARRLGVGREAALAEIDAYLAPDTGIPDTGTPGTGIADTGTPGTGLNASHAPDSRP